MTDSFSDEIEIKNIESSLESAVEEEVETPLLSKKWIKTLGWTSLTILSFLFFTFLKLPEDRLKNYIEGNIASILTSQNIGFSANEGHVSVFFGLSYIMKGITLTPPAPSKPIQIEEIRVSPAILPMVIGKMGGKIRVKPVGKDAGSLEASFSMKKEKISFSYDLRTIDLGKVGLLSILGDIKGSAIVSGKGDFHGDFSNPSTLTGQIRLDISKVQLDAQSIQGFSVPQIRVSEGKVDLEINQGKAVIKTFELGKATTDDLRLKLTGGATLGRQLGSMDLNTRADFSLSAPILKAFSLLDMLLGAGKQDDGSYAFNLNGPVTSLTPTPVSR